MELPFDYFLLFGMYGLAFLKFTGITKIPLLLPYNNNVHEVTTSHIHIIAICYSTL